MKSAKCLSKTRQQHSLLRWLVVGLGLFAAKNAFATEYYVSPTGSDSGAGTQAAPFATVQKANDSAAAGDTIWMRAGTYNCTSQITLSKSGTSDTNRTQDLGVYGRGAYSRLLELLIGQRVVGQASNHRDRELDASEGARDRQRQGRVQWLPLVLHASHQECEQQHLRAAHIHNGFGPGFFIDTGTGGNLVLNCDSHDNYDVNGSQGMGKTATASAFTIKPPAQHHRPRVPLMAQLR